MTKDVKVTANDIVTVVEDNYMYSINNCTHDAIMVLYRTLCDVYIEIGYSSKQAHTRLKELTETVEYKAKHM